MLNWALTFLVIGLIAGLFGFFGVAGVATQIAWVLFVVFMVSSWLALWVAADHPFDFCDVAESIRKPFTSGAVLECRDGRYFPTVEKILFYTGL